MKGNYMPPSISPETHTLETTINALLSAMAGELEESAKYAQMADQLQKLYALKEIDAKIDSGKRISRETWAVICANLAGILIIVGHERAHVVTSKALNFLLKLR